MFKKLVVALLALVAAAAFAAVDVNKADQSALESIKGIGPGISGKILDERKKGAFKDWNDLIERVKGVGEGNAAKFSGDGLTVNGASFNGAPPVAKKATPVKPAAAKATKDETRASAGTPAAKAESKPVAAGASAPMTKAEIAAQKRAEKKAAKEAAADKLADKKAAKEAADKPVAAASAAKK
jgi:competence protein ComEA